MKTWEEFTFLPQVLPAIAFLSKKFSQIFIVTNQRGIARKLMTRNDLEIVHEKMLDCIKKEGGRIEQIYYSPDDRDQGSQTRKPEIGMALQARKDFPQVDFRKSIMVGDSLCDLQFGRKAGMKTVFLSSAKEKRNEYEGLFDLTFANLYQFSQTIV